MSDEKKQAARLEIEFVDEVYSAADLESEIEAKAKDRQDAVLNSLPQFLPSKSEQSGLQSASAQTIRHHLTGARRALASAETAPHLANSPALSTPILGKLWGRIRGQMHELVLFYVNRSNVTHSRVDGQLIEAVEALAKIVDAQ